MQEVKAKTMTSGSRAHDERGWHATFHTTGMEHSPTSATGTGWERTPWHATQRAAWKVRALAEPMAVQHHISLPTT
jgi:hypothetical protein